MSTPSRDAARDAGEGGRPVAVTVGANSPGSSTPVPSAATTPGLPPLDAEGVLWVAAIDRVPIEERIEWVKTLKERVEWINERRAGLDVEP